MATILKVKSGGTWVDVPAIVGPQGATGATGATGPAGAPVATDTGVAVVWTEDKIYNTYGSPGSGNITESMTGAVVGSTIIVIHSAATEPTYPASWHRLKGSFDYKASGVNMIYAQYIGGSRVQYTITQEE